MLLQKKTAGSVGEHEWDGENPTEVPDDLGAELVALNPDEFSEVDKPKRGGRAPKTPVEE